MAKQPAWNNRYLAQSLFSLIEEKKGVAPKKEQKAPADLQSIRNAIRKQLTWTAFWESLLDLSNPIVRYVPTLLFALATPVGIVALLGINTPATASITTVNITTTVVISISLGVVLLLAFIVLRFISKRGIYLCKLEIDERYNLYLESAKTKLQVQMTPTDTDSISTKQALI